jgi:formate transporter
MYFMPLGMMLTWGADAAFWSAIGSSPADYAAVDVAGLIRKLVPVTIGNIIGGGVFVGLVYWFVYLRRRT